MSTYDPATWYFVVGQDTSQVWSSAAKGYVSATDPTYLSWVAAGNSPMIVSDLRTLGQKLLRDNPSFAINKSGLITSNPAQYNLQNKIAALAALRYAKEVAGLNFQASSASSPALFETDRPSQAKITSAFMIASAGHWVNGTPWKCSGGVFVPLSASDVQSLGIKVAAYVAACFAKEAVLTAALQSNPDTDISTGWPSNS